MLNEIKAALCGILLELKKNQSFDLEIPFLFCVHTFDGGLRLLQNKWNEKNRFYFGSIEKKDHDFFLMGIFKPFQMLCICFYRV